MSLDPIITPVAAMHGTLARIKPERPIEVHGPDLIRTGRMNLRPLRETDHDEFIRAIQDSRAELDRWSPLHREEENDEELFRRQIELTRDGSRRGTGWRRTAFLDNGRLVGAFNINAIARGMELCADTNWWVATEHVGRGLATEGVGAILTYALADLPHGLGLHRLTAWIQRDNLASIRVAQKAGFGRAGDARDYVMTGNEWKMHDCYERRVA